MQVKMTDKFVRRAPPGAYSDLGCSNLALQIVGNSQLWFFVWKEDGKRKKSGLGSFPDMNTDQAREACGEARKRWKAEGIDPKTHRAGEQIKRALTAGEAKTFRVVRDEFVAIRSVEEGWSAKYVVTWSTLDRLAPSLMDLPIGGIAKPHVMQVLGPLFRRPKRETVRQVHGKIAMILEYAYGLDYRASGNPVRWALLGQIFGKGKAKQVEHHAAVAYAEMPKVMAEIRELDAKISGPLALEFTILTAARAGEACGAKWTEIDRNAEGGPVWTVPAERMKSRKLHRVPLSTAALAVLDRMEMHRRKDGFIFPGRDFGKPLTVMALWDLVKKVRPVTTHGFRSTFRDWVADKTDFAREIAEHALAHVVGEEAEQAYHRSDMLEKRRKMMEAWADYCGKVITMRSKKSA